MWWNTPTIRQDFLRHIRDLVTGCITQWIDLELSLFDRKFSLNTLLLPLNLCLTYKLYLLKTHKFYHHDINTSISEIENLYIY